jgi:hypothetical protein
VSPRPSLPDTPQTAGIQPSGRLECWVPVLLGPRSLAARLWFPCLWQAGCEPRDPPGPVSPHIPSVDPVVF